jgi:hypothetical protein
MHGTIMLLFWATAGGVHSRNDVLPLQIDATEMAFSAVERLVHCGPRRTRAAPGGHCRGSSQHVGHWNRLEGSGRDIH